MVDIEHDKINLKFSGSISRDDLENLRFVAKHGKFKLLYMHDDLQSHVLHTRPGVCNIENLSLAEIKKIVQNIAESAKENDAIPLIIQTDIEIIKNLKFQYVDIINGTSDWVIEYLNSQKIRVCCNDMKYYDINKIDNISYIQTYRNNMEEIIKNSYSTATIWYVGLIDNKTEENFNRWFYQYGSLLYSDYNLNYNWRTNMFNIVLDMQDDSLTDPRLLLKITSYIGCQDTKN